MLRSRARVGRTPVAVRRPGLVPALLLALLLPLTGCGSTDGDEADGADEPSKAALSCREQWGDLEAEVDGRNSMTNPSALAPRWTTIAATVDYYATSARASDCGESLEAQERAMDDLSAFGTELAPYDMELRLDLVQEDAEEYAASPTPPAPEPSPKKKKKGKNKQKRTPAPPTPAAVARALKTLTAQAPVATQEQGPGWQQAAVAELADTAAVAKTIKDLAFLSSESPAYRACSLALTQIDKALNPVKTP